MKPDAQLKKEIQAELDWDPAVNATHVGVAVRDGIVTLTGHLDTYAEKFAIERAVQRVQGVQAVALELDVKLGPLHVRSDTDIAQAAEAAFKWHAHIPSERVRVQVERGWVTLTGDLDWEYQRHNAEKAVRALTGVQGVRNQIELKPQTAPESILQGIRDALARQARREADNVHVAVEGSTVRLSGTVNAWPERAAAEGAAWSARGVTAVVNDIKVRR